MLLYLHLGSLALLVAYILWSRRRMGTESKTASNATECCPESASDTSARLTAHRLDKNRCIGGDDDQRILREYPWSSYVTQPPAMKRLAESAVISALMLDVDGTGTNDWQVPLETCAAFLQAHSDVHALLLRCWEAENFESLCMQAQFRELSYTTRKRRRSVLDSQSERANQRSPITRTEIVPPGECDQASEESGNHESSPHKVAIASFSRRNDLHIYGSKIYHISGDMWQITYSSDHLRAIAKWFSPTDYRGTHKEIARRRGVKSGLWFLQTPQYDEWYICRNKRLLWCPGIPGVGKTVMASLVIDHLRALPEARVFVGVIYFNYKLRSQQNKLAVFESLCRQIFEVCQDTPSAEGLAALHAAHTGPNARSRPTKNELHHALILACRGLCCCYIILDALDEYLDRYSDKEICDLIEDLLSLGDNVKLLVTSRILGEMDSIFKSLGATRLDIVADEGDMKAYLQERVTTLERHLDFEVPRKFSHEIVERVFEVAKGRFLMAELHMNLLSEQLSLGELEDTLNNLPNEIDQTYARVVGHMQHYSEKRRNLAMKALIWVAYSYRRLTLGELQHALATEQGRSETEKYITPLSIITSVCAGLIIVQEREGDHQSDDSRVVRFVHFTTQEFFTRSQAILFPNAHRDMFRTCLDYLLLNAKHSSALYDYAARYWGYHTNTHSDPLFHEVLPFLERGELATKSCMDYALRTVAHLGWDSDSEGNEGPGVFLAIFHNQIPELSALLNKPHQALVTGDGKTPMIFACILGHIDAIRVLLRTSATGFTNDVHDSRGISPPPTSLLDRLLPIQLNTRDKDGRSPLWYAVQSGHESVVKLLLEQPGIHVDSRDSHGQTPFSYAVRYGQENVVKILLKNGGVKVDSRDNDGRTPFSYASQYGHESIVKLLLNHGGIRIDSRDKDGQTPLTCAARYGQAPIVEILLKQSHIKIESKDKNGQTPLSCAAQSGRTAVVKLLLGHPGIEIDSRDYNNETPLSYAAQCGHECVVKLLLDHRGGVDVNATNLCGQTPIFCAAMGGHHNIVRLLLDTPGIQLDTPNYYGQTPVFAASNRGHEAVLRLLLEHGGIAVDTPDHFGWTPLLCAALSGHTSVVKLLLQHGGVNINTQDVYRRTPLTYAVQHGNESVVKLLLEQDDIEADTRDNNDRTPLSYAAEHGNVGIVKMLLEHGEVEVDSRDVDGRTPLSRAAQPGHDAILRLLLECDGIEVDSRDVYGQTPFLRAAKYGHESTAKLLIEHGGVTVDSRDVEGRTPLSYVSQAACEGVVKMLLENEDVEVNSRDNIGRTPLSWATQCRCFNLLWDIEPEVGAIADTVRLILTRENVDINVTDKDGRTPLYYATRAGKKYRTIAELLRERGAV